MHTYNEHPLGTPTERYRWVPILARLWKSRQTAPCIMQVCICCCYGNTKKKVFYTDINIHIIKQKQKRSTALSRSDIALNSVHQLLIYKSLWKTICSHIPMFKCNKNGTMQKKIRMSRHAIFNKRIIIVHCGSFCSNPIRINAKNYRIFL